MIKYHKIQHKKIYRSTQLFLNFIKKNENLNNKSIVDIGCGSGSNTIYLAKKYPSSEIIGIDKDLELINFAKNKAKAKKITNCKFIKSDILNMRKKINLKKIDLVISFHFLSFIDFWYDKSLKEILKLNPKSIAHSSLFYEGSVEAKIYINDFSKNDFEGSFYNIFSTKKLKKYLLKKNYPIFKFEKMGIDIKLNKPKHDGMGSYTFNDYKGKKLLKSGPLLLPHGYFYAAKKKVKKIV